MSAAQFASALAASANICYPFVTSLYLKYNTRYLGIPDLPRLCSPDSSVTFMLHGRPGLGCDNADVEVYDLVMEEERG